METFLKIERTDIELRTPNDVTEDCVLYPTAPKMECPCNTSSRKFPAAALIVAQTWMLLRHPSAREWWIIDLKVSSTVDSSHLFLGVWYPALKRRGGSLTVGCNEEDAPWEWAVWCAVAAVPDLANLRWEGGQGCSGVGGGARKGRAEVSVWLC